MGGHRTTPVAADLSLRGLGFHLRFLDRLDPVQERLVGRAALGAVALVGALTVVKLQVTVQVALELIEAFVEGLPERHAEELHLHRAMETFTEGVRLLRACYAKC